ncbi:bis(5'-nucleosyl)-tetraphosphatase (symmetrical) YqeK [Bacillus marinisedimentorum]|uniref:bis(5'-nucleosyl)-tetraphosphatase (symmetrical) YqeK n=1 Tax=Bacillus marinisedimentorum TaxID=1821260 RepID=UPI0008720123|nr:bis(5'-nucleosyl)-tetraphosphatase (symmetrical) YqeK [Bacillus marinisedimentorum]
MQKEKALDLVKGQLTEKRYRHTLGVAETAVRLAGRNDVDEKEAELAAIFHDYAKFRDKSEMKRIIKENGMDDRLLEYHHELWHAPAGAVLVREETGLEDADILSAIRWHTTGKAGMTALDKVIFLADYIEPGRSFPGVNEVRSLAEQSLDDAVILALKNTIQFIMSKGQPVFPDTVDAYNDLVMKKNKTERSRRDA